MTDLLTLHEAAELAGVPPEQLKRWAWTGNGPKNSGSKLKPRYAEEDVEEWKYSVNLIRARWAEQWP